VKLIKRITIHLASYLPALPPVFLVKNFLYRKLCGYKIGANTRIGKGALLSGERIEIGDNVVIGRNVQIGPGLRKVVIGDYCSIQEETIIEGDDEIEIGDNCWIGRETLINVRRKVCIEDNVGIGMRSQLWTHGYFSEAIEGYPLRFGEILVKKNVWLPPSVVVLPGVTIGENTLVGTGAIITKDVPSRVFAFNAAELSFRNESGYRKDLSLDEKRDMLIKFLNDLFGQCRDSAPDKIVWTVNNRAVYLVNEINKDMIASIIGNRPSLIISMKKVPEEMWGIANSDKISLFDVKSKLCTKTNSKLEAKFRRRANDYLIRFKSIDKIKE
jgi:acetyltransferase-like isoleucine patch superfamily enzyme